MVNHNSISGIYVILNTKDGKVYIEQAKDFHRRWKQHLWELRTNRHRNKHLQSAWNKYGEKVFKFKKLEYCLVEQLDIREQHYLNIFMPKGLCYNVAKDVRAATRGVPRSAETKRKISEANRNPSAETRRKRSQALRGRIISDETRQKLSQARRMRPPPSEETRRKTSESLRGKKMPPFSAEHKRKLSEASKRMSKETRDKITEASKKRPPITEETRQKLRDANKRRPPISEETRRKMSEGAKRAIARRKSAPEQE